MSSWPTHPLVDLVTVVRGTEPGTSSYTDEDQGTRFLRVGDISGSATTPVFTSGQGLTIAESDDVLLALDGSPGVVSTGLGGAISSGIRRLRPVDPNVLDRNWLRYVLLAHRTQQTIRRHSTGVTIQHASRALPHIVVPLPPMDVQLRLVAQLTAAEALISHRSQAIQAASELPGSFFHELFVKARDEAWPRRPIHGVAAQGAGTIRTGPFGSQLLHSEFKNEGIPVLGIDNVVTNAFVWAKPRYISEAKYAELSRYRVYPGDVLITIMGTVGRCCVAPPDLPECISTKHLCVVTPDLQDVDPHYLWAAVLFDPLVKQQTGSVAPGAIMEGWNMSVIRALMISLPPMALQKEFAASIATFRAYENSARKSAVAAQELFSAMLETSLDRAR